MREFGMGPERKTGSCRAEVSLKDFLAKKYFWMSRGREIFHQKNTRDRFPESNSCVTNKYWLYRLTVRTAPSQGTNRGSIPRRVTN